MKKQSIIDKINQIKSELSQLAKQVRELPSNPNVEQLGHNCVSIKSSEIFKHDKWSPEYHIFSKQYNVVAELIEELPIDQVLFRLNRIIKEKRVCIKQNWIIFHPEVIENLKTLIN